MGMHVKHSKVSAIADGADATAVRPSDWNDEHELTVDIGGSPVPFYEEGTWTPVVKGETTAGTATYSNQSGRYTRIGRVVHITCYVTWNSHTGTGPILITGFPAPSASDTGPALSVMAENTTYSGTAIKGFVRTGSGIELWGCASNVNWVRVAMDATGDMFINGSYTL